MREGPHAEAGSPVDIALAGLEARAKAAEAEVVVWRERYSALRSAAAKVCYEHHLYLSETPRHLFAALLALDEEVRRDG